MTRKDQFQRQIDRAFKEEDWLAARRLLNRELKKNPASHWLLTRISATYYEQRKYRTALQYSLRALATAPKCPLALWDCAGALAQLGYRKDAIGLWKRLLRRSERSIAGDKCGEGEKWARSLLNDCRYRIGKAFRDLGNRAFALKYYRQYLVNRAGTTSIYSLSSVRKELRDFESRRRQN